MHSGAIHVHALQQLYKVCKHVFTDTRMTLPVRCRYGTYEPDRAAAKQVGAFIPNCCPGGAPFYHPDVRLTGAAAGPGTHADYYTRRAQTVLGTNRGGLPQ